MGAATLVVALASATLTALSARPDGAAAHDAEGRADTVV